MSQTMPSAVASEKLPLAGGYYVCAPTSGSNAVWSLRKADGGLAGYFLNEADARAFSATQGAAADVPSRPRNSAHDSGEVAEALTAKEGLADDRQETKLEAARERIRWLSQQFQAVFATAADGPAPALDRSDVAEAINKTRCYENGISYRPLAQSASYERDYCLKLADAVLALGLPTLVEKAA